MSRPYWLTAAIGLFGEPWVGGPTRPGESVSLDAWIWFFNGKNHNVAIEQTRAGCYEVSAGGPGRTIRLYLGAEPTERDVDLVCATAWPAYRRAFWGGDE